VQERVLNLDLKPSVRTVYNRTAFQASDSNNIRISIDTNLELSAEPDVMRTIELPFDMLSFIRLAIMALYSPRTLVLRLDAPNSREHEVHVPSRRP